jgi:hypothetical protein
MQTTNDCCRLQVSSYPCLNNSCAIVHLMAGNYSDIASFKVLRHNSWSGVHMLPLTKKHNFKYENIPNKNFAHSSGYSMCTTKFHGKSIFLVLCVKKDKIMSHVNPYFSINFFLPSPHKKSGFYETTWFTYRLWRSPCNIFSLKFFNNSK